MLLTALVRLLMSYLDSLVIPSHTYLFRRAVLLPSSQAIYLYSILPFLFLSPFLLTLLSPVVTFFLSSSLALRHSLPAPSPAPSYTWAFYLSIHLYPNVCMYVCMYVSHSRSRSHFDSPHRLGLGSTRTTGWRACTREPVCAFTGQLLCAFTGQLVCAS